MSNNSVIFATKIFLTDQFSHPYGKKLKSDRLPDRL